MYGEPRPLPPPEPTWGPSAGRPSPVPVGRYALGVVVTVVAVLSQYFVPPLLPASLAVYGNLPGALAVV